MYTLAIRRASTARRELNGMAPRGRGQIRQTLSTVVHVPTPQMLHQLIWQRVATLPKRKPFQFAVFLNSVLCAGADLNAQWLEGSAVDRQRLAMFFGFGAYSGATTYAVYCTLFSRICPGAATFASLSLRAKLRDRAGQLDVLKQIALDVVVYTPLWYFPWFYVFQATLRSEKPQNLQSCLLDGCGQYRASWLDDNKKSSALWIPGNAVVFCVPTWLRMPVCNAINFGWTMYLSSSSAKCDTSSD